LFSNFCFAQEVSLKDELAELKSRIETLEKKVAAQDALIARQQQSAARQAEKIAEYEAKLSEVSGQAHGGKEGAFGVVEGLNIGASVTSVIQGTNNTNNAAAGISKNHARSDATYSADVTIGREFEEIGGEAFLHLEAYYRIHVNDYLAISPDFQYIINPFGDDVQDAENIFVGGARVQVGF
jgi:uncharacterized coiled-coil protein SlyX